MTVFPPPGCERTVRYDIEPTMTPPHLHPALVLGTSALVELMELTALESIEDELGAGQTSVGTRIDVSHHRAAYAGQVLVVTSRLVGVGRRLTFEIEASVAGRAVASASHERAVIDRSRFEVPAAPNGSSGTSPCGFVLSTSQRSQPPTPRWAW